MTIRKTSTDAFRFIIYLSLALLLLQGCLSNDYPTIPTQDIKLQEEFHHVIKNFEEQRLSFDAYTNSAVHEDIAAGEYLNYMRLIRDPDDSTFLVVNSAEVSNLNILSHTTNRVKVLAEVLFLYGEVTNDNNYVRDYGQVKMCNIYTFERINGKWKTIGDFGISDTWGQTDWPNATERDWRDSPDWLKDIIGPLPEKDCYGHSIL